VVTKNVVFIQLYITVVSKETISLLLVQMDMIHKFAGIILIIFLDMLLDLLQIHPTVSSEREIRLRCYILLKGTVIRNVFTSQYIFHFK